MPAGLLDAFTIPPWWLLCICVWRGARTRGTADWTHWSRPTLGANTAGAKKLKSAAGKHSVLGNSASPRARGLRGRGADSHTGALGTFTDAHIPTHAGTHVLALTHTHSEAPHRRSARCSGGRGQPHCSIHRQFPRCLPAPTKLLFSVAVNFPGQCVYLFSQS